MAEFRLFPHLPMELRDMIWDMAIRPAKPSAHFFSFTVDDIDREHGTPVDEQFIKLRYPLQGPCESLLGAPAPYQSREISWTEGNPSAYLLDSGLWTACKASRARLELHLQLDWWKEDRQLVQRIKDRRPSWPNRPDKVQTTGFKPFTSHFQSKSELHQFVVHPHRDLICIQPRGHPTLHRIDFDWNFYNLPFFLSAQRTGVLGNLALELDVDWLKSALIQESSGAFQGLVSLLEMTSCIRKLWFIDYRIRWRDEDLLVSERTINSFYGNHQPREREVFQGSDRTLVEVDIECNDWIDPDWDMWHVSNQDIETANECWDVKSRDDQNQVTPDSMTFHREATVFVKRLQENVDGLHVKVGILSCIIGRR
ncbi:hypothetical protein JX266_004520 [Neoarthrinium moseri]|nr:hypothetical protein JX266_004520 [Neoarthrinium moseri]